MDSIAEQLVARLRVDPSDNEAYEALKTHYREQGELHSLVNLVEGWADFQSVAALASDAYLEAAQAWKEAEGEPGRARALLQRAVERAPDNQTATEELVTALEQDGDAYALAEFLDTHVRTLESLEGDPAFLALLYTRLGDLWRSSYGRADVAWPCYQRALELDPTSSPAMHAAIELAREAGDLQLVDHYRAFEAELETDPERKVSLYIELAELRGTELSDLDGAILALRAALDVAPGDVQIMHRLVVYLSQRAAVSSEEDAARDTRRVTELYYQIAQGVEPGDALDYLEAALGYVPSHDGALALLEQIAPALGRDDILPEYWVAYLACAAQGPVADERRVYLAQAYERAGQLDDAIYCLEQAHESSQVAELLASLKARRGPRPSTHPAAESPITELDGVQAENDSPGDPHERPTVRPQAHARVVTLSDRPFDAAPKLAELRRGVHELVAARKSDEAASLCREILELEPSDAEAFAFLESHYRKSRDHARLCGLLLASTRTGALSVDSRKLRLREVAAISETKLKDSDGAIEAWQSVVALDPADIEAGKSLKRLLRKAQRWDDLAAVLERDALAATSTTEKIEFISQIAAIHRDERKDYVEAAEALRQLLVLAPDTATRDELCEMLLGIEHYEGAVPLLRERADEAGDEREKLRLLRMLASTLDEKLVDGEAAFEVYQEILALRPKDIDVLDRLERIDEKSGNVARLLATLERRALLVARAERPALFMRMGEMAETRLADVDKAAEYYGNAIDLEPGHEPALEALYRMFERTGRYEDLVELLRERVLVEKEPALRVELYRRMARMLDEHLVRHDEAAEAYERVLAIRDDEEALRFVLGRARERGDASAQVESIARLCTLVSDASEKRALLFERAELLASVLDRPADAVPTLEEIVEQVDPEFAPAADLLARLCERLGDAKGLASALERHLARAQSSDERVRLCERLADLYERELEAPDAATTVLQRWAGESEPGLAAHRRLRPLLAQAKRHEELVRTLDVLAMYEDDLEARDAATLDAARVVFHELHDTADAFRRLEPLVLEGYEEAFSLLREVAKASKRTSDLAALCVRAAQEASEPDVQARHWRDAARIYASDGTDPEQAFEASLRMLATDLHDREYLSEVEDYAARAGAFARLGQVYDKLLKTAETNEERVELLVRHTRVLDEEAGDASGALDCVLRACGLAPHDESLLVRAEELARRAGRSEELLVVYDRKRNKTADDAGKVGLLLRAARLSEWDLRDRDRACAYLKAALALTKSDTSLYEQVVSAARELDARGNERKPNEVLRALIRAHREIAEQSEIDFGTTLLLRAAALLEEELSDARGAFDLLRQGTDLFPAHEGIYDALLARATALSRLDALDMHLARCVEDALDPNTAAVVLARRARLLEGPLGRAQDAADVFVKLLQLRPEDAETARKVRSSLRAARRFQDLLLAIHKQLQRVKNADEKLVLLKEAARTWEDDLKNRWEALDSWRKVQSFAPDDAEAGDAVARLEQRSSAAPSPAPPMAASEVNDNEARDSQNEEGDGASHLANAGDGGSDTSPPDSSGANESPAELDEGPPPQAPVADSGTDIATEWDALDACIPDSMDEEVPTTAPAPPPPARAASRPSPSGSAPPPLPSSIPPRHSSHPPSLPPRAARSQPPATPHAALSLDPKGTPGRDPSRPPPLPPRKS